MTHSLVRLTSAALGLLAAFASAARAQNLVANGDFATSVALADWDFPDATPTWMAFDINAAPASGSAYFLNTQAAAGVRQQVLKQCIPITQKGTYIFGVAGYTPTGQASSGNLVGSYAMDLHHADCSGGYNAIGGFYMPSLGAWTTYSTTTPANPPMNVSALLPEASILVELGVEKAPANGSFGGYFDAAYLVRDTLFMDGFE